VSHLETWHSLFMAVAGLRELHRERTREALARSALDLFARRGFEAVTIEEIAAACERAPRTFFRHFASKEEVLFTDFEANRTRLLETLAAQPSDATPFEALRAALLELATDYTGQRELLLLRHHIVETTPALRSRAVERQQRWESSVVDQLQSTEWAGHLSELDLRLLVAATTVALRVAIELWIARGALTDLPTLVEAALDRVAAGLRDL
jgi:AcrR family transcriptional regulator